MRVETLRSRYLLKGFDAALTAPIRPSQGTAADLRSILSLRTSNYEKVGALVGLTDSILTGFAENISDLIYRPGLLPFPHARLDLLGYGWGATVFRLETETGSKVLKIYRTSLGKDLEGIRQLATKIKGYYDTICSWYFPLELLPRMTFLIVHGPLLETPALAALQPYVAGQKRDVFQDFTEEELLDNLNRHPQSRDEFQFFARRTADILRNTKMCVDLLGKGNLILTEDTERPKLILLDCCIVTLANHPQVKLQRVTTRMQRLSSVSDKLSYSR